MSKIESLVVTCIALSCFLGGLTVGNTTATTVYTKKVNAVAKRAEMNDELLHKLKEKFVRLQAMCNTVSHETDARGIKEPRKDEEAPLYRKVW